MFQGRVAAAEDLDAVFRLVDAARVCQFADCNWARWVDAALVNPFLYACEIHRGVFGMKPIAVLERELDADLICIG